MYYQDDSDQLPPLPDFGPRDGRHGVDRDEQYDPYPAHRMDERSVHGPLVVTLDDAKRHLGTLITRVEMGDEVLISREGVIVARLAPPRLPDTDPTGALLDDTLPVAEALRSSRPRRLRAEWVDHGDLPELPDPGPRDGRHGVDREKL